MMQKLVGFRTVSGFEALRIPIDLPAGPKGNIPKQDSLCQGSGIVEITRCNAPRFAGFNPFTVVTDGILDERLWPFKVRKVFFGKQGMFVVSRDQHSFLTHKEGSIAPFRKLPFP